MSLSRSLYNGEKAFWQILSPKTWIPQQSTQLPCTFSGLQGGNNSRRDNEQNSSEGNSAAEQKADENSKIITEKSVAFQWNNIEIAKN